jgi:cytochrome c
LIVEHKGVRTWRSDHPLFSPKKTMRTSSTCSTYPLITSLLLLCGLAQAADLSAEQKAAAQQLAQGSGCLSCHAMTEKIVGPAYSSIAEKYKADADAPSALAQSIQYGSKGKWGRIPMPPHPSLSPEDIKTLATWVMTVKK